MSANDNPLTPGRLMSESEWESFEEQPWNPPGADMSVEDFEKEYDEAESGLVALLETFGTNDEDFFHESAVPNGTRAISFEVAHRSKLKTPRLIPAITDFLRTLPQDYDVCIQGDRFDYFLYVNRDRVLGYSVKRAVARRFGIVF